MNQNNADIFKIQSNDIVPSQGKILISEPFLCDAMFGRSVVLLIDHSDDGSMGLVLNKRHPLLLNELIQELKYLDDIPLYRGGPVAEDTLFFLHNIQEIPDSLQVDRNLYLNGDFTYIKRHILQNHDAINNIRFFVGYSGWQEQQLKQEIEENTWIVGKEDYSKLLEMEADSMWQNVLSMQGDKYYTWSRFPQVPMMN